MSAAKRILADGVRGRNAAMRSGLGREVMIENDFLLPLPRRLRVSAATRSFFLKVFLALPTDRCYTTANTCRIHCGYSHRTIFGNASHAADRGSDPGGVR